MKNFKKEIQREQGGVAGGVHQQRERGSVLQVLLKPTLTHGRADPGDSHQMKNKWGGAWAVPSQVRVVWAIPGQPT
jgi:hypothetical protein